MNMETRELYGGAIRASIPKQFLDISDIRPIPDHQEMFSEVETDRSVIIELMSTPENFPLNSMATQHWAELANVNEAENVNFLKENTVLGAEELVGCGKMGGEGGEWKASWCVGKQVVSKYRGEAGKENVVMVYLLCLRLLKFETDLLVTLNDPVFIHEDSSSAGVIDPNAFASKGDGFELFKQIISTLQVVDFSLFG